MVLSRLSSLALSRHSVPLFQQKLKSSTHQGGAVKWMVDNYPVTFLASLVGGGVVVMLTYTAVCLLKNPDLYLPVYDRIPRHEHYFNKHYFGARTPERLDFVPPVRMHYDGALELPYEDGKKVYPESQ
ncbi:unnamed protein product [Trichobilharzia szidati]|nr:unnamed protein product [Trichobilharzia szidati]